MYTPSCQVYAPATAAEDVRDAASSDSDRCAHTTTIHQRFPRLLIARRAHKKRSKKDKKKKKKSSSSSSKKRKRDDSPVGAQSFGKYGVLKEADYDAKHGDFLVWAMEVAKVDPEALPKHEERELFKTYVEDYNTATLPHKKYYDVAAYEAKQRVKSAKKQSVRCWLMCVDPWTDVYYTV